ncbi:hypothetical protein [Methylotenera sp.]|uniref:hypothetical protein n=1 Tax=Methylotenera sp. TaxID=2051956 RepID=UPI0027262389|nr:hypothetical protein [Methylotenera sp.]MDO9204421.1 hypothetical protein [Methylotenera sp.]MDO9394046.1 hypothetical protein [Methylotenera sp.]MDP1521974.1 hypothetical protein [Methylotenera sp.]MDP2072194.1 hypothetical protein [Methylotenera sp.]MDP3006795.1 hypothetical protein [Methylotenera sp.]
MRISRYFTDLMATYVADIDDLKTDSGGDDVLTERLKEKRSQIPDLMPMIKTNPEMMAVIFHKSVVIKKPEIIMSYLDKEPAKFPSWDAISSSVQFQHWANDFVEKLKAETGGEQFLLTAVMLEHLYALYEVSEDAIEEMEAEESDDLAESGGEWLSEHGFDSH